MSFDLRTACAEESELWYSFDRHLPLHEFERKVQREECFFIEHEGNALGILRYNLFWDNTPFLNLIYIESDYQKKGFGRQAIEEWESRMCALGYEFVMTSTQVDENAQHFYRKLGYTDCGCLCSEILDQPMEMFMIKRI